MTGGAGAHFASGLMLSSPRWLHKAFVAKLTLVRPFSRVYSFVRLHVGLLDKGFATETTLMLLHVHVDLFVSFQGSGGRVLLVAKLAGQTFEFAVGLDVWGQIPFAHSLVANLTFHVLQSKILWILLEFVWKPIGETWDSATAITSSVSL